MEIQFIGGPKHGEVHEVPATHSIPPTIHVLDENSNRVFYILQGRVAEGYNNAETPPEHDTERVYAWEELRDGEWLPMYRAAKLEQGKPPHF